MLGWDRASLIAREGEAVPPAAAALFRSAIGERARRRPLQHLTGVQAFWRHEFLVTPDTLIPRPDTEILVEAALGLLKDAVRPLIVDVGTGSGCIALSLAAARPDAEVHAVDVSRAALDVARGNATRLRLAGRVAFHEGDLLSPIGSRAGRVDLVVSNPPYVSAEEWRGLEPEVRDHEPRLALVPAEGAPALYRRLLAAAGRVLRPGGSIAVEVGQGQSDEVARLAGAAGLEVGAVVADLQGIPRVVVARRPTV